MMGLPNAARIILLVASIVSFIPQYLRILTRGDCVGIAPKYVLFNLIVATEQLGLHLHFIVDNEELMDELVRTPPSVGDWLNLAQFTAVWLGHLTLFSLYLYYPPHRTLTKAIMAIIYGFFLLVSVGAVLIEATLPPASDGSVLHNRAWFTAFWVNAHMFLISPLSTLLAFVALFPQLRELRSRHADPGALDVLGLAVQAAVFFVVALCWDSRFGLSFWRVPFLGWYQFVGWATIDNLIFALVQGVLWVVASRRVTATVSGGETAPLLRH